MAKKPRPGQCVHCLVDVETRNWDHVFPAAWYPDSTPENIEKWKIPTCIDCNSEYGRLEDDFGQLLSFVVNPTNEEAQGIYNRMLRAFDPRHGKNQRDKRIREKKRQRLLSSLIHGEAIPDQGIYPGLGERWERPSSEQVAVKIPQRYVHKLAEKIVRGLTYLEDGNLIGPQYEISIFVLAPSNAAEMEEALEAFGSTHSRGPGIEVQRAVTPEDGMSSLWKITIWGEFVVYAAVSSVAAEY